MKMGNFNLAGYLLTKSGTELNPIIVLVCARAAQDAAATLGATSAYWSDLDEADREYRLAKVGLMIAEPQNAGAQLHTPAPLREVQRAVVRAVIEALFGHITVEVNAVPHDDPSGHAHADAAPDQTHVLTSQDG